MYMLHAHLDATEIGIRNCLKIILLNSQMNQWLNRDIPIRRQNAEFIMWYIICPGIADRRRSYMSAGACL